MVRSKEFLSGALLWMTIASLANSQEVLDIQQDDLILGLGRSDGIASIEWVRGPAEDLGGLIQDNPYITPFVQGIEFDNLNNISHNPKGNLLGVNFGARNSSGSIVNLATDEIGKEAEVIGDTEGLGGGGLTLSNLGGLSVSPDNSKIAVSGYGSGAVIVFDYQASDGSGLGASLSQARETGSILTPFTTQGTTWKDNNTILSFSSTGDVLEIDAMTLDSKIVSSVETGRIPGEPSEYADVEYNPLVSPFLYASFSTFGDDVTTNSLYIFDPDNNYNLVAEVDNSLSMNTAREIALDSKGNLFASEFGGNVELIGNVLDPASLEDDNTLDWHIPGISASFSGIDIAVGLPIPDDGLAGDFDKDGDRDGADIDALTAEVRQGTNNPDFDLNNDNLVDGDDRRVWVIDLKNTFFGDSDFNLEFGTGDLITVFQAGQYEDEIDGNSGWEQGDWDGDGDFGTGDLVFVFEEGGFEEGPRLGVSAVPEPSTHMIAVASVLLLIAMRRRK